MSGTKIRRKQIRIEEFIQALNNVDWTSNTLTASSAAILDKIKSEISNAGGGGGGAASLAATDLGGGYVRLVAVNTISTLTATDNGNGNVTLSLI